MTIQAPRNYLITDVELNYVRVDSPVENPFGGPANYEMQIATTDAAKAQELRDNFFNVKEKDGKFVVNLRRKSVKADGTPMDKVRVVDNNKAPMTNVRNIGNGSTGNVIVWQAPYNSPRGNGVANSLTAVQVVNMVEYTGASGGVDFDIVPNDDTPEAPIF